MQLQTTPFLVDDFTGGLNDSPTCPKNCYLKADNLFLTVTDNWISRPGSVLYDVNVAQLPSGNQRVGTIINFNKDDTLLAHSGNRLFYYNSGAWTEILGPTGNAALLGATTAGRLSVAEWKKHLFITSTEQISPVKVLKNGSTWYAYTAGLPYLSQNPNYVVATVLSNAITLANDIRTKTLAHFADAVRHFAADTSSSNIITAPAATDLPTLLTLTTQLMRAYRNHVLDALGTAATYHWGVYGTVNNDVYLTQFLVSTSLTPVDLVSACAVLDELKTRYNNHAGRVDVPHNSTVGASTVTAGTIGTLSSGPSVPVNVTRMCSLANQLKTAYNAHISDAGQHPVADTHTITVPNSSDLPSLITLLNAFIQNYESYHEPDAQKSAAWSYHKGKENANHDLAGLTSSPNVNPWASVALRDDADLLAVATKLSDIVAKFNAHDSDSGAHNQVTKHQLSNQIPTVATYTWAFHYRHTYTIGSTTFETDGPVIYRQAVNSAHPGDDPSVISNIPSLSNGTSTNYDTSNITVQIYRTIANGSTYYWVDSVANGASSYSDTSSDANIQARSTVLYTSGGVLGNEPPPAAKFVHTVNNFAYYGNTAANPNRINQSLSQTLDGVPGSLYVDLPQPVQGISSTRSVVVSWTQSATYRIEGSFDLKGQGQMSHVAISNTTGLVASLSPVQTEDGIVFCGVDGFYFTDGYQVKRISRYWAGTYIGLTATATQTGVIQGNYDRANRRIWWGVSAGGSESDSCVVLDLNFPLTENSVFTTLSGGTNFAPTAVCYFAGQMIRGDSRGYIFKHDSIYTSDPKINTGAAASTWNKAWVTYLYKSPAFDFGVTQVRKWISQMVVKCQNRGTNLSLQTISNNDDGRVISYLTPIRFRGGSQMIEEKRKFPAGSLRCGTKQIQFTNAKVVITNSDTIAQGVLDHAAKTLTLLSGSWPADLSDQVITFSVDGYVAEWTIASQTSTVLTISDPGGTLPVNGTYKWEVKGYPKDEKAEIVSYSLPVAFLGSSQQAATGESGANA